jgi:hypothetical protein
LEKCEGWVNPINTANQLLATDEDRGRVMSVMLLAHQGGMPLGHLIASFLTALSQPPVGLAADAGHAVGGDEGASRVFFH